MITNIAEFLTDPIWGSLFYVLPFTICAYGYTARTWNNYRKDVLNRDDPERTIYYPTDTIGSVLGRALVSIIPLANLWAAAFDIGPEVFGDFFRWLGKLFDQPLVPKRKQP